MFKPTYLVKHYLYYGLVKPIIIHLLAINLQELTTRKWRPIPVMISLPPNFILYIVLVVIEEVRFLKVRTRDYIH